MRRCLFCLVLSSAAWSGSDTAAVWSSESRLGFECRERGELMAAKAHFSRAMEEAEKFPTLDARVPQTLNSAATVFLDLGFVDEALQSLNRAVEGWRQLGIAAGPHYSHTLCNLALCYRQMGRITRSRQMYRDALAACNPGGACNQARLTALSGIGEIHYSLGELEQAEASFRAALDAADLARDRAIVLNNLANVCSRRGHSAESVRLWSEASSQLDSAGMAETETAGYIWNNLALRSMAEGRFSEADEMFRKAAGIFEKNRLPETETVLTNYSALLRRMKRGREADQVLRRAGTFHVQSNAVEDGRNTVDIETLRAAGRK